MISQRSHARDAEGNGTPAALHHISAHQGAAALAVWREPGMQAAGPHEKWFVRYTGEVSIPPSRRAIPPGYRDRMARTKESVHKKHLTAKQKAIAAERSKRLRNAMYKAASLVSTQEIQSRAPVKEPCTPSESEEDSETEPEEDTFTQPEPEHVIKLSAEACGNGGRVQWRGRLRGGGKDLFLERSWVRRNFKAFARERSNNLPLPPICSRCCSSSAASAPSLIRCSWRAGASSTSQPATRGRRRRQPFWRPLGRTGSH